MHYDPQAVDVWAMGVGNRVADGR